MWLYMVAIVLIIAGVVGGIATGGIFTIVLLPLGILALLAAIGTGAAARFAQRRAGGSEPSQALPHAPVHENASVPTSPEALADARRAQQ